MTELEKMQRAKMYIDKLANGINPLTDLQTDENDIINQVRISRCLFYVSQVLDMIIANGGEVGKKVIVKQLPFSATQEQLSAVKISEQPIGVAVIAKNINEVIDDSIKNCTAVHISNWMLKNGYLCENIYNNKPIKVATAKGEDFGIFTVDAVNQQGFSYKKNVYSPEAQQFIVEHINEIEENANE